MVANVTGWNTSILSGVSIISAENQSFFPPFSSTGVRFFSENLPVYIFPWCWSGWEGSEYFVLDSVSSNAKNL